jgi:hypothetical protein
MSRELEGKAALAGVAGCALREPVHEEVEQEFESRVGIADHEVVGERDEVGEALGRERAEVVAHHRDCLVERRLVGRRLAAFAGLVDCEAVDDGDEEVVAEHGERVGDVAGAEDGEHALAVGKGVGAHGDAADRDADYVAVAEDGGAHRACDLLELFAPTLGLGVGDVLLADDLVEEEVEQAVLAADVAVERGGAGVELVGHAAHAEAVEAVGVEDAQRGGDDRLAGDGVAARPAWRRRDPLPGRWRERLAVRRSALRHSRTAYWARTTFALAVTVW